MLREAHNTAPIHRAAAVEVLVRLRGGGAVLLVGRLADIDPGELRAAVRSLGGRLTRRRSVKGAVALVVVGQRDWPLTETGALHVVLRALSSARAAGRIGPPVVSEEQFLGAIGLGGEHARGLYTAAALTRVLSVPASTIRGWVNARLICPARIEHGVWHFDFRQVSACKTICDLAARGISLRRLRRSLRDLRTWLAEADVPLAQLAIIERDGDLLVRLERGELAQADGQLRLDFDARDDAEDATTAPLPLNPMSAPRSAGQWFDVALEQQASGYLDDAAESYRQSLLLGGPDARAAYHLAGVLAAQGRREAALERFSQAVEIDTDYADAWCGLGMVLIDLGRREEALPALRRALSADADHARAHYELADLLDALGRAEDAARHWRAYLRYDQTSDRAQRARERLATG